MKTIAIIGTGLMGTDIACASAMAGFEVLLYDIDRERAEKALGRLKDRFKRYVHTGRIDQSKADAFMKHFCLCNTLEEVKETLIVIECAFEDIHVKQQIFRDLDRICRADAVLASNTSSISITEIASATKRPESVIGLHFLNPAHVMKLVEIIPGIATTRETVETAKTFVKKLGKVNVESKDYPGFLLNRMLIPLINEAIYLLYEGAGTAESIDRVMKVGLNFPMGPLALADMIGLDVLLAVIEEMHRGYSDSKYRPCPLLKKYVAAGYLGKKSGRGFFIYND
ncbi:MAG TPA: 3-hydroxyacyl-CoA dehydrogenase NAD-binding domain-containing protein [Spirochaetota bacterium]|jgi:3-hydroxybutyryl-CoA dehydrogenase|nr:3-hydroxyacyl-CoA dehydrogenase NAD-binding domain-containing protein [Spirochaetota bacterium]HPV41594.1 3-hydroxyacyl-CoA dehydrogenase NAD-binding domain-containing protein [Spirochaetota bacterium]